jgi:hypothetical protein
MIWWHDPVAHTLYSPDALQCFLQNGIVGWQEEQESQDYQIKVYLVPRLGNHASSSDVCVQYVKYDPNDTASMEQYEHLVAFIKEKPSTESIYKRRPQQIVNAIEPTPFYRTVR